MLQEREHNPTSLNRLIETTFNTRKTKGIAFVKTALSLMLMFDQAHPPKPNNPISIDYPLNNNDLLKIQDIYATNHQLAQEHLSDDNAYSTLFFPTTTEWQRIGTTLMDHFRSNIHGDMGTETEKQMISLLGTTTTMNAIKEYKISASQFLDLTCSMLGLTFKQTGKLTKTRWSTVKNTLNNLRQKCKIEDIHRLVIFASQTGIFPYNLFQKPIDDAFNMSTFIRGKNEEGMRIPHWLKTIHHEQD